VSLTGRRLRSFKGRAPAAAGLRNFLPTLWERWTVSPSDVAALVVATRGVWSEAERRRQAGTFRRLARKVEVLADAQAAYLGALGAEPGLLVLAGTGSIVVGRSARGRWVRRGGLGPLLGDEGSAFWIGREWLRAHLGVEGLLRLVHSPDATALIARAAMRTLAHARRGDRLARRIIAEAQRALARQAMEAARALALPPPVQVSWAGKMLEEPDFRSGAIRELRRAGLSFRVVPPREPPVAAAARLALRLAHSHRRLAR
jgi:N-acetylglucosamine kinase-like BadF-type ATPase